VLKTARAPVELAPGWTPGAERVLLRCLRRSYRLDLMAPGQRCLLWWSGRQAGVHAIGRLAGAPEEPDGRVPVALRLLAEPVPRGDLLPSAFASAEVIRMPAGSNPSWLDDRQLDAVLALLDPAAVAGAGWTRPA
jgi:hypothetical protein